MPTTTPLNTDTIFRHYGAVEKYYRLLKASQGARLKPDFMLNGLDVYLMHLIATMSPTPLTVIDLTGADTLGATAYSWLSQPDSIRQLISGRTSWQAESIPWQHWLIDAIDLNGQSDKMLTVLDAPIDTQRDSNSAGTQLNTLSTPFLVVTGIGMDRATVNERLAVLRALYPQAIMLIGPLGQTGESATIAALSALCENDPRYRFVALREVSPFFVMAQFGLVYPTNLEWIVPTLKRLHDMYDGNFGYLNLLAQNYALHESALQTQQQTISLSSDYSEAGKVGINAQSRTARVQLLSRQTRNLAVRTLKTLRNQPDPYHVSYLEVSVPHQLQVGQIVECQIVVRNDSTLRWTQVPGTVHGFNMSYHWLSKDGLVITKEGIRTSIPPLDSMQSTSVDFSITAPGEPGVYILEIDTVYEGYSWFSDASGVHGPRFSINVVV